MDLKHKVEQHERTGNLYQSWCMKADDLFAAARVLKAQYDTLDLEAWARGGGDTMPAQLQILPALLMLRGMGLECLLKALWLKQGHPLVEDGEYVGVPNCRQHDLAGLAAQSGFAVSPDEKHLLINLSDFITHIGRYPIARTAGGHLRMVNHPRGGKGITGGYAPSDETLFGNICERLYRDLGVS